MNLRIWRESRVVPRNFVRPRLAAGRFTDTGLISIQLVLTGSLATSIRVKNKNK